jgi:drug/metabolite transporter (DMT)-like permease
VRRLSTVDAMLLATVLIWALNVTATKYILEHGFRPLAYAAVRYGLGALVTAAIALALDRSLAVGGRRALLLIGIAVVAVWANQICFVYALKLTTATSVSLILGSIPIFAALISAAFGERLERRFWVAAIVSFGGVALVALGSGGSVSANVWGDLIAIGLAFTWASYSVAVAPLMREYSPYRISSIVLLLMWIPLFGVSAAQIGKQDYGLSASVWLLLAFAVLGPLVLTNVLWFTALDRVGPSHATLFANLQPFVGALFAVWLLSESLSVLEIVGGVAIGAGIVLARRVRVPVGAGE